MLWSQSSACSERPSCETEDGNHLDDDSDPDRLPSLEELEEAGHLPGRGVIQNKHSTNKVSSILEFYAVLPPVVHVDSRLVIFTDLAAP